MMIRDNVEAGQGNAHPQQQAAEKPKRWLFVRNAPRTVHQRPPKKTAPSPTPATHASARVNVSFIVILLFLPHRLVFLGDPVPRVQTADRESGHQQRQRPGMLARMVFVQPDAERRTEQRRNDHRPADQPHHAQPEPDALTRIAPCLELARRLRADLPGEGRFAFRGIFLVSSFMLKAREATQESRLQFRHDRAHASAPARPGSGTPAPPRRAIGRGPFRPARGARKRARPAGLDQHAFIHGHQNFPFQIRSRRSGFPARAPPHNRAGAAGVRTSPRASPRRCATRRFLGEDLERQENLKIHERRPAC
jgi:hypothetical protein